MPERDFHTATAVRGRHNRKIVAFGGRSRLRCLGRGGVRVGCGHVQSGLGSGPIINTHILI